MLLMEISDTQKEFEKILTLKKKRGSCHELNLQS